VRRRKSASLFSFLCTRAESKNNLIWLRGFIKGKALTFLTVLLL